MLKNKCQLCGKTVNRRIHKGCKHVFCNRECAGLYKRKFESKEDFKERKRLYDIEYRKKNKDIIKIKKQKYCETTAGRLTQKRHREKVKKYHLEYCRSLEYRKWKRKYDNKFISKKYYGDFHECINLLRELENQIKKIVPDKYARLKMRGLLERIRTNRPSRAGLKI